MEAVTTQEPPLKNVVAAKNAPSTADDEERLDWDTALVVPPSRTAGIVRVQLTYAGRSKPIAVAAPENED